MLSIMSHSRDSLYVIVIVVIDVGDDVGRHAASSQDKVEKCEGTGHHNISSLSKSRVICQPIS